jgi:superfamily II DNA/RNA helicase
LSLIVLLASNNWYTLYKREKMTTFQSLGLPAEILSAIERLNFTTPTPIQAQTIPLALEGLDVLGSAQTGTGKTAAFSLPLLAYLMANPKNTALIMTPTRELAQQVMDSMRSFMSKESRIWMALLIGGDSMGKQLQQLRQRPRLIIGTPGRINDHLERGTLSLDKTGFLVLDETDRMLDMGFVVQLEQIAKYMPEKRQTLMFSATIAPNIERLAGRYLVDPQRISVGSTIKASDNITQEVVKTTESDKFGLLVDALNAKQGSFIVFVKTKMNTEKLAKRLSDEGHSAEAIHGDLRQRKRSNVIHAFRKGKNRILVATDVAARGLDIPHIEYVVNFDLPQAPEDFIHRIGRTGRAGAEGTAISFVSAPEASKWRAICRLMHPEDRNKHAIDFGKDGREDRGGGRGRNRNRRRDNDNRDRNTDGRRRDFDGRDRGNDNRDRNNDGRRKDFDSRDRGTDNRRRDNDNRRLSAPKSEDFGSVPTAERKFRDKPRADKVKSANTPNRGSKKPSSRGKFSNGSGKKFATGGRKGR